MKNIKLSFKVTENIILREFLIKNNISKKTLTRIKFDVDGSIRVNGIEQNVRYLLKEGDLVELTLPNEYFNENIRFIKNKLKILYEDEFLIIIDKPKNLPTIPSRNYEDNSLLEYINYYFKNKNYKTIPHIVTRLDKNTTGIVLVAKHRHIHSLLSKINIEKYYLALAEGKTATKLVIEANIKRDSDSIITRHIASDGEYAKTKLTTLAFFHKKNISLIKLKLYTGRTHQIRVHCKHIGNSLLGDELYNGNTKYINRQALHCYNLKFNHPITNKKINIISPLPSDILRIIKSS